MSPIKPGYLSPHDAASNAGGHSRRAPEASASALVQNDGCDHDWFEGRGPRCTLLVFVDDATGQLMELRFARTETTFDYFAAAERYLRRHGKPIAFYSDKASGITKKVHPHFLRRSFTTHCAS